LRIKSIAKKFYKNAIPVYDLTTEYGNFTVGKNKCVVHNCNYHHGETSAAGAVTLMAQDFKNNLPVFEAHGSFGSRLIPEPSAPRYIFVKLNKAVTDAVFVDNDILENNPYDVESPEPKTFLPLIPMVLVNGAEGIAVGFATTIIQRDPINLVDACIAAAKGKEVKMIEPSLPRFRGNMEFDSTNNRWVCHGIIKYLKTVRQSVHLRIEEIPYGISREKYVAILDDLVDAGKISGYSENCREFFEFDVVMPKREYQKLNEDKLMKLFKLIKPMKENITVITPDQKLVKYENDADLIKAFVEYRISRYPIRFAHYIERDSARLAFLQNKLTFIKAVLSDKFEFKKGVTKAQLIEKAVNELSIPTDHAKTFINIPLHSICFDEVEKLMKEIKELKDAIEKWKSSDPVKTYIQELRHLKKILEKNNG